MVKVDLTEGKTSTSLLKFIIPTIFSYLATALYSALNIFIISNSASEAEISVVLSAMTPINLCRALILGVSVGGTFLIGQYYGAKDINGRNKALTTFGLYIFIFSLILMGLVMGLSPVIVKLLNIAEEYQDISVKFLLIAATVIPVYGVCYFLVGTLKGCSKTVFPFIYLFSICGLNILFDFLLIRVANLGAIGSAISLVSANLLATLVACIIAFNKYKAKEIGKWKLDFTMVKRMMKYSLPLSIEECVIQFTFMVLVSVCNENGFSTALAISDRITELVFCISYGVSNAVTVAVAQCLGSYKIDKAKDYVKWGIIYMTLGIIILGTPIFICMKPLAGLYGANEELQEVIFNRSWLLYIQLFVCAYSGCFAALQSGSGQSYKTMILYVVPSGVRAIMYLIFSSLGFSFFWLSLPYPICEVLMAALGYIFYKDKKWMDLKRLPVTEDVYKDFKEFIPNK